MGGGPAQAPGTFFPGRVGFPGDTELRVPVPVFSHHFSLPSSLHDSFRLSARLVKLSGCLIAGLNFLRT